MNHFPSPELTGKGAPDYGELQDVSGDRPRLTGRIVGAGERGAGHLKAIIFTLILAAGIFVGFKVIPILVNEYEFQDGMQTIARFASVNRDPSDKIRTAIVKEAEKDDVPVQADDVKIQGNAGNVRIDVDYSVTVDLAVYQWTLNFHPNVKNDALF